ncbi:hypothetical protein VTK26DRAFT_1876 [Humicola hyalothermophila]
MRKGAQRVVIAHERDRLLNMEGREGLGSELGGALSRTREYHAASAIQRCDPSWSATLCVVNVSRWRDVFASLWLHQTATRLAQESHKRQLAAWLAVGGEISA